MQNKHKQIYQQKQKLYGMIYAHIIESNVTKILYTDDLLKTLNEHLLLLLFPLKQGSSFYVLLISFTS